MLRRHLSKRPELVHIVRRCWYAHVVDGKDAPGPIGIISKHVKALGWSWHIFDCFERPGRMSLPLLSGPDDWWRRELRDGICLSLWSAAAVRRNDMQGLDATEGIDRKATLALYSGKKLQHSDLGLLRGVISGSIRLQKRLHDAKLVASPVCPFCGLCDETLQHCFWDCTRWQCIRAQLELPNASTRALWPPCTSNCGIFIEDPQVIALQSQPEDFDMQDLENSLG